MRIRPTDYRRIKRYVREHPGTTRSEVAKEFRISYWAARWRLDRLVEKGELGVERVWTIRHFVRRVQYYPVPLPPKIYYRTQFAEMYYSKDPRTGKNQTPDPIAEFRVVVVSKYPGIYDIDEFKRACIYIGVILAPQTYWIAQERKETAYELDEPIDADELPYSVPVFKKLHYAERYAVFFKSRQRPVDEWWRTLEPEWWKTGKFPTPREGDYEYDEIFIKDVEKKRIALGRLKMRFNNVDGKMESVTV